MAGPPPGARECQGRSNQVMCGRALSNQTIRYGGGWTGAKRYHTIPYTMEVNRTGSNGMSLRQLMARSVAVIAPAASVAAASDKGEGRGGGCAP